MAGDLDRALAVAAVEAELGRVVQLVDDAGLGRALVEIAAEAAACYGRSGCDRFAPAHRAARREDPS